MKTFKAVWIGIIILIFMGWSSVINGQGLVAEGSTPEAITTGFNFTEGPYWHPDGYLLFSDIPANAIMKWTPGTQKSEVFMQPSGHSNGITSNNKGELILAQHDGMISKVDKNQNVVVLTRTYKGKRLNSPNDVVVSSKGTIYFTDPPFGVSEEDRELKFSGVYMLKPGGEPQLMFDQFDRPNGIALSPDESRAYVNNTSSGNIKQFEISADGELTNPTDFAKVGASAESGAADGMTVDAEGRVYSTGPGGMYIFSPQGKQLQKVELPARATNLSWGGSDYRSLFITTPSAVYRLKMNVSGRK